MHFSSVTSGLLCYFLVIESLVLYIYRRRGAKACCLPVFLVFKKMSVRYFQLCASLTVHVDPNAQGEKEHQEKDWDIVTAGGVCKRPHRGGDIISIPAGEANQDSCWAFCLLIFVRLHSVYDQRASQTDWPCFAICKRSQLQTLALGPALSLTSRYWPPFRHRSPVFLCLFNSICHTHNKHVQAAQMTIMLHFLSLRQNQWFQLNAEIWAGAMDLQQLAVLLCSLALIKPGAPHASTSMTRPVVEGEGIRWWNRHHSLNLNWVKNRAEVKPNGALELDYPTRSEVRSWLDLGLPFSSGLRLMVEWPTRTKWACGQRWKVTTYSYSSNVPK